MKHISMLLLNILFILLTILALTSIQIIALFLGVGFFAMAFLLYRTNRKYLKKNKELLQVNQQYAAKIDQLNKTHNETLEKIREDMLKNEEARTFQWIESEKETLNVLSGLSILLDMNEKLGRVESEKILAKIQEVENKILGKIKSLSNEQ